MPLQWEQDRRQNMTDVRRSAPSDVIDALKQPPPPIEMQEGEIVYIKHATTGACLYARSNLGVYNKVKLDTSGYPDTTPAL